jgi:uncharacterized protein YbaP (TraB family)
MRLGRFRFSVVALALCIASFAALPARAAMFFDNHPALFRVENGDAKVYVFGSYHMLKPQTRWVTDRLIAAMEEADTFIFEVEPTVEWMPAAQDFIDGEGYLPEGNRLSDMLSPGARDSYRDILDDLDLDPAEVDKQQPWLAQLTLASAFYGERAYSVEHGADVMILRYANSNGHPVRFLETPRQQLEFFAAAMEQSAVPALERVVASLVEEPDSIAENIRTWRSGDVDQIASRLRQYFSFHPEMWRMLLSERNAAWAGAIETMMHDGGTYFVTVGVGHLGGEDSVIDILCTKGWNVARVPTDNEDVPDACPGA